jgi:ankyrin repeat protein
VDATSKDGRTPLHLASFSGTRAELVHPLLDHGANADAKNKDGRTSLYEALSQGKDVVVRLLLDHGADANTGDNDCWTPLHNASFKGETNRAPTTTRPWSERNCRGQG